MNRNWMIGLGVATLIVAMLNLTHADKPLVGSVDHMVQNAIRDHIDSPSSDPVTVLTRTLPIAPGATLHLSQPIGDLEVEGTDDSSASLTVISEALATGIDIATFPLTVDAQPTATRIEVGPNSDRFGPLRFVLRVPRSARLDLSTQRGDLRAIHLSGGTLSAAVGSGDAQIEDVIAPVSVQIHHGDLRMNDTEGALSVSLGRGDVALQQVRGAVTLDVGSGDVVLNQVNGELKVRNGHGDVSGELTGVNSGVTAQVGSGDIALSVPSSWGAEVTLVSRNGGLMLSGWPTGMDLSEQHSYQGRIGGGGAPIEIKTGNGDIHLSADQAGR